MINKLTRLWFSASILITSLLLTSGYANISSRINSIINNTQQKKVDYSIHIINADTDQVIYSRNSQHPMIPASNMKLIITSAALDYLGADFQYKTVIGTNGNQLIVIGAGDPLLGDSKTDLKYNRKAGWIFRDITQKLKKNDIDNISDIIVDTSIFDDNRIHPNWPREQLNQWYACEISGLNYNNNCVAITVKNNSGNMSISIDPPTNFIKTINSVIPISSGSGAVGAYRNAKMNTLIVKGKCRRQQGPFDVAIERPAAMFGYMLYEHLKAQNITVTGELLEKPINPGISLKVISTYTTTLKDCLDRCNKNSLGLAAESLLKTIAAKSSAGKNGSWKNGSQLIMNYLAQLNINTQTINIDDGSGLSRENRLTTEAICMVLDHQYQGKNWKIYKDSLATGGIDGTIAKYFKQPKYKGRVFGKTGYIAGVKSFSGYCATGNKNYIFSIIANKTNGKTRPAINDIVKALFE